MAQADSVPSSSRQLITGESANQSTSLRAVKLPAVSVQPVDRHHFSAARTPASSRTPARLSSSGPAGKDAPRRTGRPVEPSLVRGQHRSGAPGLEHRGLRDRRLFAWAVVPEDSYPASVPERE